MTKKALLLALSLLLVFVVAGSAAAAEVCVGFGPQTPRDIDSPAGENARIFSPAPSAAQMNLCNIHFHAQAEHRAAAFSLTSEGAAGYQCNDRATLTGAELAPLADNHCRGVEPGDTIEVHWVYSSCDVTPGKSLGACLSDSCGNPDLRVETQVFLVVNDPEATDFRQLAYGGNVVDGYHQPKRLPDSTGVPVEFLGSTTGPSFDQQTCSPLQVTWSVRPECARLDLSSLSAWCAGNVFEEDHAHGVRPLVTDPRLLSEIEAR
jgi:hypothetical protein